MTRAHQNGAPAPDAVAAVFRDLTGADEVALAEARDSPQARARRLLEVLAAGLWRDGLPVALDELTLGEADGLLADLHAQLFASRLPCEAACAHCGARFEFTLDLPELRARLREAAASAARAEADGTLRAASGRRFRPPRLADLARLEAEGAEAWLRALLIEGPFESEPFEAEMAAACPVLAQDIAAACPDCGAANRVRFDMARFLVETLAGEAPLLWREVHLIARAYGWGLAEILALTRPVRRQLAGLIVAEAAPARLRVAS